MKLIGPGFRDNVTVAPALRPCSAANMLVWILNSRTASTLGRSVIDSVRRSLLSMPSYRKLFDPSRLPFENNSEPGRLNHPDECRS